MKTCDATWTFDCPCKNTQIKKKKGEVPLTVLPKDFYVRPEDFGILYYSRLNTPVFFQSFFQEATVDHKSNFILSAPILVILEITDRCNLNCIHCYKSEGSQARKNGEELKFKTVKRLVADFKEMQVVGVQFTGGEPFLHEDLVEMLRESKKQGLKTEVVTNGYKINESTIVKSSRLIDGLFVSIDGTRETHNQIRRTLCFDSSLRVLREFSERGVYTTAIMTLNRLNYSDISRVYELVSDAGARELILKRMLTVGRGKEAKSISFEEPFLPGLEATMRTIENSRTQINFAARCVETSGPFTFFGCPGGRTQIVINCNGNVSRCLYKEESENIVGNIYTSRFREIWQKNNDALEVRGCKCCEYSDRCGGLCSLH